LAGYSNNQETSFRVLQIIPKRPNDLIENQQHRHLNISPIAVHDIVRSTCGYGTVFAHCILQQLGEHFKKKAMKCARTFPTTRNYPALWRKVAEISAGRDRNSLKL
jgi:hypothetical protein